MPVSVVVVTYNGWAVVEPCLAALSQQTRPADEVIVVDNGSTDGTSAQLRTTFPTVRLVEAGSNLGFADGANRGIARASGDIVVLVNNDAVAEPSFLENLVSPLEHDPSLGSVAATMVFSTAPETVASGGIEVYDNLLTLDRGLGLDRANLPAEAPVFGPSAGAAAYRKAALDDVQGFPADFFMYLEDADLAWRLRLRGWESLHVRDAVVRHDYSGSAGEGSPFKRRLIARNRLWMITRCVPGMILRRAWPRVLRYELLASGYGVVGRDVALLTGRVAAMAGLPSRLKERRQIQAAVTVSASHLQAWLRPEPPPLELLRLRRLTARLAADGRSA